MKGNRLTVMDETIVSRPDDLRGFDRVAKFGDLGGGDLEELEAFGQPAGKGGLEEVVEDVAAFAALFDDTVGAEKAQMLGDAGVRDAEDALEGVDVFFPIAEFFDDADAVGMGEDSEEFGELFGDDGAVWHRVPERMIHGLSSNVKTSNKSNIQTS